MAEKLFYRESVIELLEEISSEKPLASASELICRWFDDLYLPGFNRQDYAAEAWP